MKTLITVKRQSIPLVPFNAEQNKILVYQPFVLLLHKLGFHLPADADKLFVRIPEFWTTDILFSVAEKLGPIHKGRNSSFKNLELSNNLIFFFPDNLKFDINLIHKPKDEKLTNLINIDSRFLQHVPTNSLKSCFGVQGSEPMNR